MSIQFKPLHTKDMKLAFFVNALPSSPHTSSCEIKDVETNARTVESGRFDRIERLWRLSKMSALLVFTTDLLLTMLPLLFLAFALCAITIDQTPISTLGSLIVQASKIGPSIFPIVFAAVVGRLMRAYGLWKAEHGIQLGVLEQMIGSHNLLATLEKALLIRNASFFSLTIVILWCLSPLGGQSSLRICNIQDSIKPANRAVHYFDVSKSKSHFVTQDSTIASAPAISAMYRACLLAPDYIRQSSTDLWSNPKIPRLEDLQAFSYSDNTANWYSVRNESSIAYSSFTGIPIAGLPNLGVTVFLVETSYLRVQCSEARFFPTNAAVDPVQQPEIFYSEFLGWLKEHDYYQVNNYSTNPFMVRDSYTANTSAWNSFMVTTKRKFLTLNSSHEHDSLSILYATQAGMFQASIDRTVTMYECSVSMVHVEAELTCPSPSTCLVDRMRRSQKVTTPSNLTPFNTANASFPFYKLLAYMPLAGGRMHEGDISPTDFYMLGSDSPYNRPTSLNLSFRNLSAETASIRLSSLINTIWQASLASTALSAPQPQDLGMFVSQDDSSRGYAIKTITAVTTTTSPVYAVSKVWAALTAIISLVLVGCGIAGLVLKYLVRSPDILGYVSTMTRDNPYFSPEGLDLDDIAAEGGDGLERARLLRNVHVQLADVRSVVGNAHVVLRSIPAPNSREKIVR